MRLLILTQKIDIDDGVLGFFHGWIEKFAENFEFITAVCLQEGRHDLPKNVKVLSLGKEAKKENAFAARAKQQGKFFAKAFSFFFKIKYSWNFYKHIWRERKNYDAVFVHMNQEYVLLGGLFWKLLGKKIFLWRNHKKGSVLTRIAGALSNKVFYTSEFSYTAKFKNAVRMPVGIDTNKFGPSNEKRVTRNAILSLGRIDPVKKVHILVDALKSIGKLELVDICGDGQGEYYESIKREVKILSGVATNKTPEVYGQYEIFVNMTPSGSFDKTIIEAAASGLVLVVCNKSLEDILPKELIFKENDARDLAQKIEYALNMPQNEKEALAGKLRKWVGDNHSLDLLAKKLVLTMR